MTQIKYVSRERMEQKTGFKTALGYALPKEDTIFIRKGLPKKIEEKVKKHEEEHIAKGEEGPLLGALIGAGASILGGIMGSKSAGKAARAQTDASAQQIQFARESRDMARQDAAPYREAGYTALDALMSLTGLGGGGRGTASVPRQGGGRRGIRAADYLGGLGGRGGRRLALRYGGGPVYPRHQGGPMYNINEMEPESRYEGGSYTRNSKPQTIQPAGDGYIQPRQLGGFMSGATGYAPTMRRFVQDKPTPNARNTPSVIDNNTGAVTPARENPGGVEGGYNFQTDPGYEFRVSEGMRALDRGSAASGGLLSGGYSRRAIRYGQDYASQEYTNVYNRIANIAGLGQVAGGQSGQAALYAGAQMGQAASNAGAARASGYTAQGNAWSNTINEIGKLPWEDIFNRDSA